MAPRGQEILWTHSDCACSAVDAFDNHIAVNSHIPPSAPLFTFETENGGFLPMKRSWFLDQCNEIWTSEQLGSLHGHAFHIGGTTHLLLSGVNPFVIMVQGRWKSTAFLEYWHHCEEILPTTIAQCLRSHPQSFLLNSMSQPKTRLGGHTTHHER